jgi:hypothetical protein
MIRCMNRLRWMLFAALAFAGPVLAGEPPPTNTVTLARHATGAEVEGTSYHACLGMTSLCPDKCGQSGTIATFKIIRYVSYEKLGEYGDPKCEQFVFMVEDNMKNA